MPEPVFRHLDDQDVPWQAVKRQRNADGSIAEVREKWLSFSADPQYLSLYAQYDPGMIVRRHGHFSPHVVFVISGGLWCADRWCPAGTHIELPSGAAFGPREGPASYVSFDGVNPGTYDYWSDGRILVRVPPGLAGRVMVTVTTPAGTSAPITLYVKLPCLRGVDARGGGKTVVEKPLHAALAAAFQSGWQANRRRGRAVVWAMDDRGR